MQADKVAKEAAKLKAQEDAKKAAQVDAMRAQLEQQKRDLDAAELFRDNLISQGICQRDNNNFLELTEAGRAAAEAHHSQRAESEQANESLLQSALGEGEENG